MKKTAILLGLALIGAVCMAQNQNVVEAESETYSFSIGNINDGVRLSDVDVNIPQTKNVNDKTYVVIFANQKYQKEQDVPFAVHDGEVFMEYCLKTLGIPKGNIRMQANATLNNMKHEVDWLKNIVNANRGEARGIVFYSGHGMPNDDNRNSYLLPVDGYSSDPESGYSLDKMYADLGNADASVMTYFIDACFSGVNRSGEMMEESRGVAIKSKGGQLQGKSVVFSAAQGDETAYAYQDKSHGMFTYFLLKKLQDSKGNVSYGELAKYIADKVSRLSLVENPKGQNPVTTATLNEWEKLKFNK